MAARAGLRSVRCVTAAHGDVDAAVAVGTGAGLLNGVLLGGEAEEEQGVGVAALDPDTSTEGP